MISPTLISGQFTCECNSSNVTLQSSYSPKYNLGLQKKKKTVDKHLLKNITVFSIALFWVFCYFNLIVVSVFIFSIIIFFKFPFKNKPGIPQIVQFTSVFMDF